MLDLDQLTEHLQALNTADRNAWQQAIRALKLYKAEDWDDAPDEVVNLLVASLGQLLGSSREAKVKLLAAVRQDVVLLLGNLGPRAAPALPELLGLLEGTTAQNLREAAVTALGRLGPQARPAVDKLIRLLDEDCPVPLAARVARALSDIGYADPRAREALAKVWRLSVLFPESRAQVALALCRFHIDVPGLLPSLTGTLVGDAVPAVRKAAVEAFGWRGQDDQDTVPALTVALYDPDEEVRHLAGIALAQLPLSLAQALALCGQRINGSTLAETALRKSGLPAVPALITALEAEDALAREKAARILSSIGEAATQAAPGLAKLLRDQDRDVRLAAAKALWNITGEGQEVVPVLAELLTTERFAAPDAGELRRKYVQSVIEALARIGRPAAAALPALLARTKDENRLIREAALRALKDIDPAAVARAAC